MGSEVAKALCPLPLGRGVGRANLADGAVYDAFAALAGFYDVLTGITLEDTAVLGPEGTLGTGKDGFAFHGIVLPPLCRFPKKDFGLKDTHYLTV